MGSLFCGKALVSLTSTIDALNNNERLVVVAEDGALGDLELEQVRARVRLLQHLLDRPVLYAIPALRDRFEASARANLERALGRLAC